MRSLQREGSSSVFPLRRGALESGPGLRQKDLESGEVVDGSAMFGVIAVKNTNRSIPVHDRQRHDLRRRAVAEAFDKLEVGSGAAHFAALRLARFNDVAEDRGGAARNV